MTGGKILRRLKGSYIMDVLIIIAQKGFQPMEYKDTRAELEKAGLKVVVASITTDTAVGKDGSIVKPDIAVKNAEASDYTAIAIIGGRGAVELGKHKEVFDLLKDAYTKDKVIAAICIAPTILANAGLLEGKKATVWNEDGMQEHVLAEHGAFYVDEPVVVDGKIVTANGPMAAKEFGKTIAKLLKED
jgi:protease I